MTTPPPLRPLSPHPRLRETNPIYHTDLLDLCNPVPNGVERFFVCDIVNEEDALRASKIGGRDGAEALLPGRVPDLELDSLRVTGPSEKKNEGKAPHGKRDHGSGY